MMMRERRVPPEQRGGPENPSTAHGRPRPGGRATLGIAARRKTPEPLAREGEVLDLPARAILAQEGQYADDIYLVESGVLMLSKSLKDDRRQVLGFRLPGDAVLFRSCGAPWSATLQAVKPTRVRRISWTVVQGLLESEPGLCQWFIDLAGDEIAAAQTQLLTVGRRNKEERLAAFLLEMWHRTGSRSPHPPEISLAMHRLEIADYLGLTTETVSRVFARLAKDGIIAMPHPSRIIILSPSALESLALGRAESHRPAAEAPLAGS